MTNIVTDKDILKQMEMLCSRKEYCVFEINEKLKKFDISHSEKEAIIKTLENNNFIDELRYAKAYVNDKFKFNKWGRIKIRYIRGDKGDCCL